MPHKLTPSTNHHLNIQQFPYSMYIEEELFNNHVCRSFPSFPNY